MLRPFYRCWNYRETYVLSRKNQTLKDQVLKLTNTVNENEETIAYAEAGWDDAILACDEALAERDQALHDYDQAVDARDQALQRVGDLEGIADRRLIQLNDHFHRYQRDAWGAERTLKKIDRVVREAPPNV